MTFLDEVEPLVLKAAIATVRKWPSYVSLEDVEQELRLWTLTKQNSIETAMRAQGWEAKVYSTMLKVASSAASLEDQQTNGYSKEDTYSYSVPVLETLLESCFTHEDWQSFGTFGDGMPHAKGQVNETGDVLAMLSDVKAGMAELKAEYREILFYKFGLHWTSEQIADRFGITSSTSRSRAKRAVRALQAALGQVDLTELQNGWSERREVFDSDRSQILTERQYNG